MPRPRRLLAPVMLAMACKSALTVSPGDAGADGAAPPPVAPAITLPDGHGGSRLRLSWWTAPGGASVPGGITDSEFGVSCSWALLEGGFRCLPPRERPTRYSDPECTQPLLVHDPRFCAVSDYVIAAAEPATCPASITLRRRGPRVQPAATYALNGPMGCTSIPVREGLEIYEVGEPVPATDFVGATPVVEPLADGWSRVYLDGEDGSRWVQSLRRGAIDCSVTRAADGVLRCLPRETGLVTGTLLDADCATRVAEGNRSSCPANEIFVWQTSEGTCPARVAVHRASRRLDGGYLSVNGACRLSQDPLREVYAVGEELPPGDSPEVGRGILDGPGRLEREVTITSAGTYGLSSFWDSKLAFRCADLLTLDGTHRCAPFPAVVAGPSFSDPQCARPILDDLSCEFQSVLVSSSNECPQRYRVFRIGAATAVERPYRLDASGRCVPVGSPPPPSTVFRTLEELRPADLVELSLTP